MEEEKNKKRKSPIDLDWDKLLPPRQQDDDEPSPILVVTTIAGVAGQPQSTMGGGEQVGDELETMPDLRLEESITRGRKNYETLGPKLPDKGQKLLASIRRFEEENERRKRRRLVKDDGGAGKPQSQNRCIHGASCGFGQEAPSLHKSEFGSRFCRKMEENIDCRTVDAFENELTALGRCDKWRMRQNGQFSGRGKYRSEITSRQTAFQSPNFLSIDLDEQNVSNGACTRRQLSPGSPPNIEEDMSSSFSKRNDPKVHPSNNLRPRNGQTVVVVDEEETQLEEMVQQDKTDDCIKEIKIYYPSRDDPESVEICYADMQCLAPETYLSSTIMNFYIRYLQQPTSATDRVRCSYHFFSTYFYEKLKEAVLNKTSDKENLFSKFRRWWKGVNIFEKAYILLPIHEYHHWSLVIICIPDKDDETGPILLHLDSLGLHSSRSIFDNIKSFLIKEWNYLNQQEASSNYHIADRIWQNLPRRIDQRTITVPQQKNEYDCGLFVLFFMERFIEEAPQRLKKKDLAMFGKKWFNPKEASDLRQKIRYLLRKKFKEESEDTSVLEA